MQQETVTVTNDIRYIGVNDHHTDLFEGQYMVPNGMSYNSYVIMDEKILVTDTVAENFADEWLENLAAVLGDRRPDYLLIHHMEPDHSANIVTFMMKYPETVLVASEKAFTMMRNYFGTIPAKRMLAVSENDTLSLGKHTLLFISAAMVHWPEVIMSYDIRDKVLFTADAFGKFGALDTDEPWIDEARRYYFGIVSKHGNMVQKLLHKLEELNIRVICPLHGPVLTGDLSEYLGLYDTWSSFMPETDGVMIAYTSVYGNTKKAIDLLSEELMADGCPSITVTDLATADYSRAVADAFRYSKLVFATTTLDADLFPFMKDFIHRLCARGFRNRTIGFVENGSWAPQAARLMRKMLDNCDGLIYVNNTVHILSSISDANRSEISALARELTTDAGSGEPASSDLGLGSGKKSAFATIGDGIGPFVKSTLAAIKSVASLLNSSIEDDESDTSEADVSTDAPDKNTSTSGLFDKSAMFKIGYGLYVVTLHDGTKDNGLIVNTVTQVTSTPNRIAVTINKLNYSHDVIRQTGMMNINCLSVDAPFSVFEAYGFRSGKDVDKFAGAEILRSGNGLIYLPNYINAYLSLLVEQYVDLGTHGMFICLVTAATVLSDRETMTYTYYQQNVKPKPVSDNNQSVPDNNQSMPDNNQSAPDNNHPAADKNQPTADKKKGYVCKICGYVYEGDELPDDFVCPICKHGAEDFEPLE